MNSMQYIRSSAFCDSLNSLILPRYQANITNLYNQVPHLTQDTKRESEKNKKTSQYKKAKSSALVQQVATRLQEIDITVWQRQTQITKKKNTKEAPPWNFQ